MSWVFREVLSDGDGGGGGFFGVEVGFDKGVFEGVRACYYFSGGVDFRMGSTISRCDAPSSFTDAVVKGADALKEETKKARGEKSVGREAWWQARPKDLPNPGSFDDIRNDVDGKQARRLGVGECGVKESGAGDEEVNKNYEKACHPLKDAGKKTTGRDLQRR